jgi:hypothetical protein
MDMRKMQARADLERMVYNHFLTGSIEIHEADQIVLCLNRVIGCAPAPRAAGRGKIIPFPEAATRENSKPAGEESWVLCHKISRELGLDNIKHLHYRILNVIEQAGVKSVEELAGFFLEEPGPRRRESGTKAVSAIREALKARGYGQPDVNGTPSGNGRAKPEEGKA